MYTHERVCRLVCNFVTALDEEARPLRIFCSGRRQVNEVSGGIWEPYIRFDENDSMNPFFEPYRDIMERLRGGLVPIFVGQTCHWFTSA